MSSKKHGRAKNQFHLNVAMHHLEQLVPDMIPREETKTWSELMRLAVVLRDQLEYDRLKREGDA